MNRLKLILGASILLLVSLYTTTVLASLIRIDIAGETVAQVERNGVVIESDVIPPIPVGTDFSGYFVYDTNTPPTVPCSSSTTGAYCGYEPNVVVDAFFMLGPLTFGQPDIFSEASVTDSTSDVDEYSWDWLSSDRNTVDGLFIEVVSVILQDTTSAAVSGFELPTEIEISDFDIRWTRFYFIPSATNPGFGRTIFAEIDDFSISPCSEFPGGGATGGEFPGGGNTGGCFPGKVPEPAVIWLFGAGLIGLIGFTRRSKSA